MYIVLLIVLGVRLGIFNVIAKVKNVVMLQKIVIKLVATIGSSNVRYSVNVANLEALDVLVSKPCKSHTSIFASVVAHAM